MADRVSTYSFGADSPIKFQISDKLARLHNEALDEFFRAQQRFNQKHGRRWDPRKDPIKIRWSEKHRKAWNEFAKIFEKTVALYDEGQGFVHENDFIEDFLVKNAAPAVFRANRNWERAVVVAVAGGVLYGLLRRR